MKSIISILIFSGILIVHFVHSQRIPHPNCSGGFKYIYVNSKLQWIGIGWAWTTTFDRIHNVTIDINYATTELPNTNFLGSLKVLAFHRLKTLKSDEKRWNIIYELKFPIQDPLPDVTFISLNGETLCEDRSKEFSDAKPDLVTLNLRYNDYLQEQMFTSKLVKKSDRTTPATETSHGPLQYTDDSNSVGCGKVDQSNIYVPLILDGTTIQRGSWPWLVSVYSYNKLKLGFRCGATLISQKLIVTAAHCFFDIYNRQIKTEDVIIILGQYNLKRPQDTGTAILSPESINIHPDYRKRNRLDSDIAVVVLPQPVSFTTYIRPVCLWNEGDDLNSIVDQKGLTAGWGRDENGNFYTELPKQVELPVVSDETCLRSHEAFPKITSEGTFCAGWRNGTEGPCNGDSGGPLVFERMGRWTLRGVVSTSLSTDGSNTCNLKEYVVFTDVAKFRSWITSFSDEMNL